MKLITIPLKIILAVLVLTVTVVLSICLFVISIPTAIGGLFRRKKKFGKVPTMRNPPAPPNKVNNMPIYPDPPAVPNRSAELNISN